MRQTKPIRSEMCWITSDRIMARGLDLPSQILGTLSLGDMAWLEITGQVTTPQQSAVFNALLVTMVEHGLTPMAIATRLIYLGAPEPLKSAVAAGLCGLGTVFAGTAEGSAKMLQEGISNGKASGRGLEAIATDIVASFRAQKRSIPGIGHPLHKPIDPRTPRLFEIARENGFAGQYVQLMKLVTAAVLAWPGRSCASMAVSSRLMCPISLALSWPSMSASCTRSARCFSANPSNAREKAASEASYLQRAKPQMHRSARSTFRRAISATQPWPRRHSPVSPARAAEALPKPHELASVNSSIRTHSRMWITFASFSIGVATSLLSSGNGSCWITFHRYMISSRRAASIVRAT